MAAKLVYWHKAFIQHRYVVELTIHEVPKSANYREGIKYGLICLDTKTKSKVLLNNHHPKGPHVHIDDQEVPYKFVDENTLVDDFKKLVLEKMGVKL